jgi:H+-translocating NAD(P) transhydrogenase subunit alpha
MIKIGIPKEMMPEERRVAAVPETVAKMIKAQMEVHVEAGAGVLSYITDHDYEQAGATIEREAAPLFSHADIILKVQPPLLDEKNGSSEIDSMKENATLIAPLYPTRNLDLVAKLNEKKITSFSLELLPRIARAQSMDILSSMSNLAGYKSVIMAADQLGKLFPMMTTAAGTILPAKVIVIGAGVAGLQAIATARRLGGAVIAFDTRPAAGEQVKSLGADFVSLETSHEQAQDVGGYAKEQSAEFYKNEQEIIRKYIKETDVIITTALIPLKRAPLLITEQMVQEMKQGSVIVDLAVEADGNCALSLPGKTVVKHGVTIIGLLNVPSTVPIDASRLYSKNIFTFLNYIAEPLTTAQLDLTDEIIKACLITHKGEIVNPLVKQMVKQMVK